MSETREELLKELNEELAKPVEEILDKTIKLHKMDAALCLSPALRAVLIARLTTDIKAMKDAVEAGGYVLALMCVNQLIDMCHSQYRLPDDHKSGEIDGLSQWLPNLATILEELIDS